MRKLKKKGFTLIELAIVLSIIGIITVVAVPKISASKFDAKNKVVLDNVDIVRDYVSKVIKNQGLVQDEVLQNLMNAEFNSSDSDNVINAFTNGTGIKFSGTSYSRDNDTAIIIVDCKTNSLSTLQAITFTKSDAGVVVVQCYNDGYYIQGVDGYGNIARNYTIRYSFNTAYYYTPPVPPPSTVDTTLNNNINAVNDALQKALASGKRLKNNQLAKAIRSALYGTIANPVERRESWKRIEYVPSLNQSVEGLAVVIDNNDSFNINSDSDLKSKLATYSTDKYKGMVIVISCNNGYYIGGINANPKVLDNIRTILF